MNSPHLQDFILLHDHLSLWHLSTLITSPQLLKHFLPPWPFPTCHTTLCPLFNYLIFFHHPNPYSNSWPPQYLPYPHSSFFLDTLCILDFSTPTWHLITFLISP
jgi:hypothetical protein